MKKDRYPKIGPFYYYKSKIISPDKYQRRVNPVTFNIELVEGFVIPGEHRDMWDKYMLIKHPELKADYDDNHKALPRGRVDFTVKSNELSFFITLDKCISGQESNIKQTYQLSGYNVSFHYGAMNYHCKHCK